MTKKLISVVLALCMILSCFAISGISASAATAPEAAGAFTGGTTVYLKPNSNWTSDGARFAIYVFNNSNGQNMWNSMTAADQTGYYQAAVPGGSWDGIIFVRMNGSTTENNWNNKWNQTNDLTLDGTNNCYTVADGAWDNGSGSWSVYTSTQTTTAAAATTVAGTTVAGDDTDYYLFGYINGANYACEEDSANMGTYKFVDGTLTATFTADSYVAVKEADNANWYMTDGWLGTEVTSALLKNTSVTGTNSNKLFVPGNVAVTFTLVDNGDDTFTLSYTTGGDTEETTVNGGDEEETTVEGTTIADTTVAGTSYKVTLIPGTNWSQDNARFAIYVWSWDGQSNDWIDMTANGDGTYSADVPSNWAFHLITRMNPASSVNQWNVNEGDNYVWNQSQDLGTLTADITYKVKDGSWDELEVVTDVETTTVAPGTTVPGTTVDGDDTDYYLFGYINGANYACEEDAANMGTYKFVNGKLTATFTADSYVAVKEADNANWYMTDGWLGTEVTSALLKNTSVTGTNSNKLYVPANTEFEFTLVDNGDDTFTLSYAPTGEQEETTKGDDEDETTVAPTTVAPTTLPDNTDYYLFGFINGADYGCEADAANIGTYKFVGGELQAKFTADSYVAVKTGDNQNWYMTDGYPGDGVTTAVLKSTSVTGENSDKLKVPGNVNVTFTLVDNGDNTFTLSYVVVGEEDTTDGEDETTIAPTTVIDGTDYYLFGFINGADYACEGDAENLGTYKFENGKLTATFTADSYVAVKTGDNQNWYMTDGYPGDEATSAVLKSTTVLGENADKLKVPGNVEVEFTLVDNGDDTLTLSYAPTGEEEETTAEPTTVEPTTVEPTTVEPTTVPAPDDSTNVYVVADSFNLKLTTVGVNKVGGEIALPAGTYELKVQKEGVLMGYGTTVNDSNVQRAATVSEKYGASIKLNASGGVYFFQFSTDSNKLVIKYTSNEVPNAYLIGDAHTILKPVDGKTLAIGSTYLEPGTYNFKLNIGGTEYGYSKTVTNTTNGATLNTRSTYKANISLVATGGTYTFTLNTATNGLIISYIAAKDEAKNDVHITGDFNLVLDDNGGNDDIATGTITLEDNAYSIQVMNYGTIYTLGEKLLENKTKKLSPSYKAPLTFIANGGTYTFTFDKTTGELTATKLTAVPAEVLQ